MYSYSDYKSTPKIFETDSITIKEYTWNIQKFIDYYTTLIKRPVPINSTSRTKKQKEFDVNLNISPEFYKKLASEIDRYQYLKWAAEQKGLWGKDKENYIKTSRFLTIPRK